ncbi:PIN domain-containing protein [Acinetobacter johnsonii]|uniref:PIN domain-containing protein n=1 Tax=Acinetobacter johnsonii TaxID=40214 RepID=UPI0032B3448F
MPLQTRNVFIDTEFFVKAGLDFSSRTLESFKDICSSGELNHITSTIVVREVNGKISDHIQEALNSVNTFRRKAKILMHSSNIAINGLFAELNQKEINDQGLKIFSDFLEDSNTKILNLSQINSDEVVEMYFERRAPFQDGKKKTEFPDAFTMLALKNHLSEEEEIYVISEDKDLIAFCDANPRFLAIESLSKLLDLYYAHDEERSNFIKEFITNHKEKIKEKIKENIEETEAYNSSSWEDAEVDSLTVTDISDFDPSIIHIDDDSCQISFEVKANYTVSVTGPDYNNGIYDREDGRIYTFDSSTREETGTLDLTVELELSYIIENEKFNIQDFDIYIEDLNAGIEVEVEENGYDDY